MVTMTKIGKYLLPAISLPAQDRTPSSWVMPQERTRPASLIQTHVGFLLSLPAPPLAERAGEMRRRMYHVRIVADLLSWVPRGDVPPNPGTGGMKFETAQGTSWWP
jgi:hypothetical protein